MHIALIGLAILLCGVACLAVAHATRLDHDAHARED